MVDVSQDRRKLLATERKQKILEWVAAEEAIDFASLARLLDVSVMTVRRDVGNLVDQGYMTLTRGGASAHLSRSLDILVNPRANDSSVAKARIGEYAARNMTPGNVVFVGTGSTTAQFIQFLDPDQDLTVITPSLPHASFLASRGVRVVSTGGLVATEDLAQSGDIATSVISRYYADIAIVGANGIALKTGLTEVDIEIAELNRHMIEQASETWVLADLSKAGVKSPFQAAPLMDIDSIITTHDGHDLYEHEVEGACVVVSTPLSSFSFPSGE
jgi:DeoR/GlpR family transcriptional regulator of sugar metabolism